MIQRFFSRAKSPEARKVIAWSKKHLDHTPKKIYLFEQALSHSSAILESDAGKDRSNERLEFLGDAILGAVVGDLLYEQYPDKGEGFLTRLRSKLVNRQTLNALAQELELDRVIRTGNAMGRESSVYGNALEAVFGAIYLERGYAQTNKVLRKLLLKHFKLDELARKDSDKKSRLLEWGQKKKCKITFEVTSDESSGKGRRRTFIAEVMIDGRKRGSGRGRNKKQAEQSAAAAAWRSIRSRRRKRPSSQKPS